MTSFTSRYGNPAQDLHGARIWAQERHGCTVLTISGRIDGGNVNEIMSLVDRITGDGPSLVLDLGGVTACTPNCVRLLQHVDQACTDRGSPWALVASDAVRERLTGRDGSLSVPLYDSVAHAEHDFDEEVIARRHLILPLLRRTA